MTGCLELVILLQSGICYHCAVLDGQRWVDKVAELSFFRSDLLLAGIAVPALPGPFRKPLVSPSRFDDPG